MACELCCNNSIRNYTHCKNKQHFKLLMKIMKIKKNTGYYFKPNLMDLPKMPSDG